MACERLIPIGDVPDEISERTGGGVSPTLETVRDWCKKHHLESRKIAGRVYVVASSLETLIHGKEEA